jgi:hypothetical protein
MSGFQSKRLMGHSRVGEDGLTIDGLTKEQVLLLDKMWQFEHLEDLEAWASTLRPGQQRMVQDLVKLVLLSVLDKEMMAEEKVRANPYPDANAYLKKFRLQ